MPAIDRIVLGASILAITATSILLLVGRLT